MSEIAAFTDSGASLQSYCSVEPKTQSLVFSNCKVMQRTKIKLATDGKKCVKATALMQTTALNVVVVIITIKTQKNIKCLNTFSLIVFPQ